MSTFTPRKTEPTDKDSWWLRPPHGSNQCITIRYLSGGRQSVLHNCTGYAWGRFSEIMGKPCSLPTSNAATWYGSATNYQRGQTPKLGSVIVWGGGTSGYGHVAIVEEVHSDGSIVTSESGYFQKCFKIRNLKPPYSLGSGYPLKGFIYNPAVTDSTVVTTGNSGNATRDKFVSTARSFIGKTGGWGSGAAMVLNISDSTGGVSNKYIYYSTSNSTLVSKSVELSYGNYLKGPFWGVKVNPVEGDIVCLRWNDKSSYNGKDQYYCDNLAVCISATSTSMEVVQWARSGSEVKAIKKNYATDYSGICGYYRPKWTVSSSSSVGSYAPLYTTSSTEEDASIREVCFSTSNGEPSISSTDIKLSVINYTSGLSALVSAFGTTSSSGSGSDDISRLPSNARAIVEYLTGKGLNTAAAIGIIANIKEESNFNTASIGDNGTSFGICQWHYGRGTAMKNMAGSNWKSNLTGQLDYLWHELTYVYNASVLAPIQRVPNTEAGARSSADIFVRKFEIPANVDYQSSKRQANASEYWKSVVVNSSSSSKVSSQGTTIRTQSGKVLNGGTKISIPQSVNQSGIIGNYTNYSYWYSRWAKRTNQRKVADTWNSLGRPSSRNIATVGGYYLCATVTKFGQVGDILTVVLEDGTKFNAMLGDSKGADAPNAWGHVLGGQVDIIEWEKVGRSDVAVDNSTVVDTTGWKQKKVAYIINYGTYFQ